MNLKVALSGVFALASAVAAVKPGENILSNGKLEADQTDYPVCWSVYVRDRKLVKWMPTGGPDSLPYFRLSSDAPAPHDTSVRQGSLHFASNGVYKLSVKVRTKDFNYGNAGVVVANGGWKRAVAVGNIPKDTAGEWKEMSCRFKPLDANDTHSVIFFASGFTGTFDVADARLTAENDVALAETEPSALAAAANEPRFVPISPLLWEIPKSRREVTFRFFGKMPSGRLQDYDLVLSASDGEGESRVAVTKDPMTVMLPKGAGRGVMTVRGVERTSGRESCREEFTFRTVEAPSVPASCGRRLNNLSTELLSVPLTNGSGPQRFAFVAPRSGWLYIAAKRRGKVSVSLDGHEVIDNGTPRSETFRLVDVGPHDVVASCDGEGSLVVRAIAEILSYAPCAKCPMNKGPRYDWPYEERHVLPAVTTENGGTIPADAIPQFYARGYRWVANLNTVGLSADALEKALAGCAGMTGPQYAGVTCDEQFFPRPHEIAAYQKGLKAYDFANSPERVIYTWIIGKPMTPSLDHAFISTSINASRGRGKLLFEMYCRTPGESEEEARTYLKRYVTDTFDRYRAWHPLSVASSCAVFGNFNQMPILTLSHHPGVDYKYYLDMQLNLTANDPSCRDLGAVGYWGCNYADDELKRWSFALMRHYVVQGHTNMLSETYGYRYRPGHLANGDFTGSLEPWHASGNVRTDSYPDFARRSQCRWGGNGGVGDTFAVLMREEGAPATLSQTATGLVPGRTYCLQFTAFDVKDVKANRIAPRRFGIDVTLGGGAEVRKDLSWVHVDERVKGRYDFNDNVARVNLHHIVFTARAAEAEVSFGNAAANVGEELGINAVSLNPYFEGSAGDM
ncbi:MAG: hypothetical protein IJH50_13955 [Kiritimatiellae bacterium]|nr:hypothetical protein [Kiritimatiellia bacterium]